MRTLSQKRSEYALKKVLEYINDKNQKAKEEFASFISGTPSQILQNGFGQSLAFWFSKSKGKDKYNFILEAIKEWLSLDENDIKNNFIPPSNTIKDFIKNISTLDQKKYLSAQKETLKLLEWIKRYAQAFKEETNNASSS